MQDRITELAQEGDIEGINELLSASIDQGSEAQAATAMRVANLMAAGSMLIGVSEDKICIQKLDAWLWWFRKTCKYAN